MQAADAVLGERKLVSNVERVGEPWLYEHVRGVDLPPRPMLKIMLFVLCHSTMVLMYRPLVPLYLDSLDVEPMVVGFTLAAYSVVPALLSLWASRIIGLMLVRQLFMLGTGMVVMGCLALGLTENLALISIGHMISGASSMMVVIAAQSYVYQVSGPREVARNFSLLVGSFAMADIIGPSLGGTLARLVGYPSAFLLICLVGLGTWGVSLSFRKETITQPSNTRVSLSRVRRVLSSPQCVMGLLMVVAAITILSLSLSFYPLHLAHLGFGAQIVGLFLSFRGLGQLGTPLTLAYLERKVGRAWVFVGASLVAIMCLVAIPILTGTLSFILVSAILGGAFGLMIPISLVTLTEGSTDQDRVFALGMRFSLNRTVDTVGPIAFGLSVQLVGPTAPFYLASGCIALVLVVIYSQRNLLERKQDRGVT